MKRALVCLWLVLAVLVAHPRLQNGTIAVSPKLTILNNAGQVVSGACAWSYLAGTTTPVNTYTDQTLATPNTNPVIADSAGRITMFWTPGVSYKLTIEQACTPPAHGTLIYTADNLGAVPTTSNNTSILGVAGQTLLAGSCAYLSDGGGGGTAGQFYPCSSANNYQSTTVTVGMVQNQIALGATGTIVTAGRVTGLTSLAVGSRYYLSTAGTLSTSTAVANLRLMGQADTASTLVVGPSDTNPPLVPIAPACGRLTLTSGLPVTTADVTAATTVYYTPTGCNTIQIYDGAKWPTLTFAELSIAVPASTTNVYDVFAFNNSGAVALVLSASWTNDTTRSEALSLQNGTLVKTSSTGLRYLGTFRQTGVSGQTQDAVAGRYVWNFYNRALRTAGHIDATASWTYTTATWRGANGSATSLADVVVGWNDDPLIATVTNGVSNGAGNVLVGIGAGEDNTTPITTTSGLSLATLLAVGTSITPITASGSFYAGVGRHTVTWLEYSAATNTTTWTTNSAALQNAGIWVTLRD